MSNKDAAFFIDTANIDDINRIWDKIGPHVGVDSMVGITTNPNALAKVGCDTLAKFEELVPKLCKTIKDIRGDGSTGLLYLQTPKSTMTEDEIFEWAEYIDSFNGQGTAIALKLPHFSYALRMAESPELKKLYVNITGISDASTVIKALSCANVFFASIIPGRMEEVGIDANEHLEYLTRVQFYRHQNVIAGSMRTIEGLQNSIKYHTIPTIGTRVWDLIEAQNLWETFSSYWENTIEVDDSPLADYMPTNTESNVELSRQFFGQMDTLGQSLYTEFSSK